MVTLLVTVDLLAKSFTTDITLFFLPILLLILNQQSAPSDQSIALSLGFPLTTSFCQPPRMQTQFPTIICCHQDCFSERYCGEGVPLWAAENQSKSFPFPLELSPWPTDAQNIPSPEYCSKHDWGTYQFTLSAALGYEHLYTNVNGLRDSFSGFWRAVAERMKGAENVLAFEILNEPFAGDLYANPLLMYPGYADRHRLQPFYDAVAAQGISRIFFQVDLSGLSRPNK